MFIREDSQQNSPEKCFNGDISAGCICISLFIISLFFFVSLLINYEWLHCCPSYIRSGYERDEGKRYEYKHKSNI
jgi:hypothetical protein